MLDKLPDVGWLEAHSENYFCKGGAPLHYLEKLRAHYPLSLHGVGLSLGSTAPLNPDHLKKLKSLVERFDPALVSEHLTWSSVEGRYMHDLLPLPYTEESLAHVCGRIAHIQDYLGSQILIENISSYLQFFSSTIPEWEFLFVVITRLDVTVSTLKNILPMTMQNVVSELMGDRETLVALRSDPVVIEDQSL